MNVSSNTVGAGRAAHGLNDPRAPIQQLGAAPGTADVVPGCDGNEPEEDGLEFASSGEAADAPSDDHEDYDFELSPEYIESLKNADLSAREAANGLLVGYETGVAERESTGAGVGLGREEAVTGSTPAYPGTKPPAILAQTPGHIGSIPAERASGSVDEGEAQLMRDGAVSRYRPGHLCSIPAERASIAMDKEKRGLSAVLA